MNSKNKPNGLGALRAKGSGANGSTTSLSGMGRAASVDASELSVANAAASSAVGAEREACADVAQALGKGKRLRAAGAASQSRGKKSGKKKRKEAGVANTPRLLSSQDDKIVQRELAYLRELRYGKRAPSADDEPVSIIFDAPRPERDMP